MGSLISDTERAIYEAALVDQFETFQRPFSIYVAANVAVISTSPTYTRFGDHSQNAPIAADNPAVTPQVTIVQGCILYGNKQPWTYMAPDGDQQLKLRESDGVVRIKVDASGYALMKDVKLVTLDGFNFTLNSTPRPHGLLGAPTRWTFTLEVTQ